MQQCLIALQHNHGLFQASLLKDVQDPLQLGKILIRYYAKKEVAMALVGGDSRPGGSRGYQVSKDHLPMFTSIAHILQEAERLGVTWCYIKPHRARWQAYDSTGNQVVL